MGLIKEPKYVDFSTKSEPWTEEELADFRKVMEKLKAKAVAKPNRKSPVKRKAPTS
jgi:hypothetical protein